MLQFAGDVHDLGIAQVSKFALNFAAHFHIVEVAITREHDLIVAAQTLIAHHLFLDLRRKHIDASNNQHVVRTAS